MIHPYVRYSFLGEDMPDTTYYHERQGLKRVLVSAGFRWTESSAHSNLVIHFGGDILCDDRYRVGILRSKVLTVEGSSRLIGLIENVYGLKPQS